MRHSVSQAWFLLGLLALSGCVSNPLPAPPPALPCPATVQLDNNKVQATNQALQKRLQEKERTIAERDQQIEVLSSQLDALKRIDQDAHHKKRLVPPAVTAKP
jgi:TolA-binding protein